MKKKISVLMAGSMLVGSVVSVNPIAYADEKLDYNRLSGLDRYETCARICKEKFNKSEVAIIASGETYPDALSSGALSIKEKAPLLLVKKDEIPGSIQKELERLGVKKVIIVGGENTIKGDLFAKYKVERIAGKDRYETSLKVADRTGFDKSILVSGKNYADALIATSVAAKLKMNIVLVNGENLDSKYNKAENIILGGTASINIPGIKGTRIAGQNRYETSLKVAEKYFKNNKNIVLASGEVYADSLSAVSIIEKNIQPIILINKVDKAVSNYVRKHKIKVTVVGGDKTIPDKIVPKTEITSSGGGSSSSSSSSHKKPAPKGLTDGVFKGTGNGYYAGKKGMTNKDRTIDVAVTVKDGKIDNVDIIQYGDTTAEYGGKTKYKERFDGFKEALDAVLKGKEAIPEDAPDTKTGATYTSRAYEHAINDALNSSKNGKQINIKKYVIADGPYKYIVANTPLDIQNISLGVQYWDDTPDSKIPYSDFKANHIKLSYLVENGDDEKEVDSITPEQLVDDTYLGIKVVDTETKKSFVEYYKVRNAEVNSELKNGTFEGVDGENTVSVQIEENKIKNIEVKNENEHAKNFLKNVQGYIITHAGIGSLEKYIEKGYFDGYNEDLMNSVVNAVDKALENSINYEDNLGKNETWVDGIYEGDSLGISNINMLDKEIKVEVEVEGKKIKDIRFKDLDVSPEIKTHLEDFLSYIKPKVKEHPEKIYDFMSEIGYYSYDIEGSKIDSTEAVLYRTFKKYNQATIDAIRAALAKLEVGNPNDELKDGTFLGVGKGYHGNEPGKKMEVRVVVKDKKINEIKILKFGDDAKYEDLARVFINRISPKIKEHAGIQFGEKNLLDWIKEALANPNNEKYADVETGATYSGKGLVEAIADALETSKNANSGIVTDVKNIEIAGKPSQAAIKYGEHLDLTPFSIKINYLDSANKEAKIVPFADFAANDIVTSIQNGAEISKSNNKINFDEDGHFNVVFSQNSSGKDVSFSFQAQKRVEYFDVASMVVKFKGSDKEVVVPLNDNDFVYTIDTNIEDAEIESVTMKNSQGEPIEGTSFELNGYEYRVHMPDIKHESDESIQQYRYGSYKIKLNYVEDEDTGETGETGGENPDVPMEMPIVFEDGIYTGKSGGFLTLFNRQEDKENEFNVTVDQSLITDISLKTFNDSDDDYKAILNTNIGKVKEKIEELYNNSEGDANRDVLNYLKGLKEKIDARLQDGKTPLVDVQTEATYSTKSLVDTLIKLIETEIPRMKL